MIASLIIATLLGAVLVRTEDEQIFGLSWVAGRKRMHGSAMRANSPGLKAAQGWLDNYFAGTFRPVDFAVRAEGSDFQRRVWQAIAEIPRGQTATYGDIARAIRSAPRAVGGACGANPIAVAVPCHRVLAAGGRIGGYSGGAGLDTKRALLRHEGITVSPRGGRAASSQEGSNP
ncbi:MAG: methylated-DNA--[protein]-cysteine S-methyltransferase [Alphaproteobacteria bacterium]|nr:methylated-DNA--[protein]-cysteine S-methyltransferase [Alphaproteobacteria bacterium]